MCEKIDTFIAAWDRCSTLFFTGDEDYSSELQALSFLWTNDHWAQMYTKDSSKLESKIDSIIKDACNNISVAMQWNDWVRRVRFMWQFCVNDPRFLTYVVDQALIPGLQMKFELMMKIHRYLKLKWIVPNESKTPVSNQIEAERKDWEFMENAGFSSPISVDWLSQAWDNHVDCKMK